MTMPPVMPFPHQEASQEDYKSHFHITELFSIIYSLYLLSGKIDLIKNKNPFQRTECHREEHPCLIVSGSHRHFEGLRLNRQAFIASEVQNPAES